MAKSNSHNASRDSSNTSADPSGRSKETNGRSSALVNRRNFIAGATSSMALNLSGCFSGSSDTIEIIVSRPGYPDIMPDLLEPAKEEFEEEHSNVEIVPEYDGWGTYYDQIWTRISEGNQPHVSMTIDNEILRFMDVTEVVPLEDKVSDEIIDQNLYLDHMWIDDHLRGITAQVGPFGVWHWRKDLYEEAGLDPERPPQSFEEIFEHLEALDQNTDVAPIGVSVQSGPALTESWGNMVVPQTGEPLLDPDTFEVTYNNDAGIAGTEFWKNLEPYSQDDVYGQRRQDLRAPFVEGRIAVHVDGPWALTALNDAFDLESDDSPVGIAAVPPGSAGQVSVAAMDPWCIIRNDSDEQVELSAAFLELLCTREYQELHNELVGGVPVRQDIQEEIDLPSYWDGYIEAAENTVRRITHPDYNSIQSEIISPAMQAVWEGEMEIEAALQQTANEINNL